MKQGLGKNNIFKINVRYLLLLNIDYLAGTQRKAPAEMSGIPPEQCSVVQKRQRGLHIFL